MLRFFWYLLISSWLTTSAPCSPTWKASPNIASAGSLQKTLLRLLQGQNTCHFLLHQDLQSQPDLWQCIYNIYNSAIVLSSKYILSNYRKLSQKDDLGCTREHNGPDKVSSFHVTSSYLLLPWPWLIHTSLSFIKPGALYLTKHFSSWSHKWFQWLWHQDK